MNYEGGSISPIGEEEGWKEEVLHTSKLHPVTLSHYFLLRNSSFLLHKYIFTLFSFVFLAN